MKSRPMIIVVVLGGALGVSATVLAKGYGGQPLSANANSDAVHQAIGQIQGPCFTALWTAEQCLDATAGMTECGRARAQYLIDHGSGPCASTCLNHEASPEQCRSTSFLNSVCGQLERHRMAIPDDYPAVQTPHPSPCVNEVRTYGSTVQSSNPSVFGDPPVGAAVVPSTGLVPLDEDGRPTVDDDSLMSYGYSDGTFATEVVPRVPPSFEEFESDGMGRRFSSKVLHEDIEVRTATGLSDFGLRRLIWGANGDETLGCREYAYEKYYDYTQWEDRTHFLGSDARAKVDAAFDDPGEPWAIGSRQLLPDPVGLRRKDGVETSAQVWLGGTNSYKNDYFTVPVFSNPDDRLAAIMEWEDAGQKVQYTFQNNLYERPTSRPVNLLHPIIMDEGLYNTMRLGREVFLYKSWAWHDQMNTALAGYPDEQLFAMDAVKERFVDLLFRRRLAAEHIMALIIEAYGLDEDELTHVDVLTNVFDPGELINPFQNLADLDAASRSIAQLAASEEQRLAGAGVELSRVSASLFHSPMMGGQGLDLPGGVEVTTYSGQGPGQPPGHSFGRANVSGLVNAIVSRGGGALHLVDPEEGNRPFDRIVRLTQRLANLDQAIEDMLHYADSFGCLDTTAVTPCDWSPELFVYALHDRVAEAREADYQRCTRYTATQGYEQLYQDPVEVHERFHIQVNDVDEYVGWGNKTCDLSAYNGNIDDVELYFLCVDKFRQRLVQVLNDQLNDGVVIDPETGEVRVADNSADGDWLGGGAFGVGYDYEGRWSITGLAASAGADGSDENWCELKPHLHGHFSVEARVMYADVDLFAASGDVGLDPDEPAPHGEIEIVGQSLINVSTNHPDAATFHPIIDDQKTKNKTFFSVRATVTIGPVPLTLRAGLGGTIGAGFQLAVGSGAGSGGQSCHQGGGVLRGLFSPFTSVDAFASVSLDAVIVEAGIKITLFIVTVSFPFTIQLSLEGKPGGNNTTNVQMVVSSDLDVVFTFLAGKVSAFVEFCFILCERAEATIFSWGGLRVRENLVHTELSVPLRPLAELAMSEGGG